jgi:hypothetical protein
MQATLNRPVSRNSINNDPSDIQILKKILNRLGYYKPLEKTGITPYADEAMFQALSQFQRDYGLPVTGSTKNGDQTLSILEREANKIQRGSYIWRTAGDDKVRKTHAAFDGTIRTWDNAPDPGEDMNCRCWAEKIDIRKIPVVNIAKDRIASVIDNTPAIFDIKVDHTVSVDSKFYEDIETAKQALELYDLHIITSAHKHNIDPDLIRSIMWAENVRGSQIGLGYTLDRLKASKTILPMNIYKNLWYSIIPNGKKNLYNAEHNIEAGTIIIKRLQSRIVNSTPEKIGALWNSMAFEKTNEYAIYIGHVYKEKPWKEAKP